MVDICLPSPSWGKHNHPQDATQEQKPTYRRPEQASPTTPSSQASSKYNVDSLGSGTSTKSCFNIFSTKKSSVANSSSHSSVKQQQRMSTSRIPTTSAPEPVPQESEEFAWEAFQKNEFTEVSEQWQTEGQEDIGDFALLQPPKPTDRSHKQRLKLEQNRRKSGVYDGELEPEGVRGQEAPTTSSASSPTTSTPIRSFDPQYQKPQRTGRNSSAAAKALRDSGRISPEDQPSSSSPQQQQPAPPQQSERLSIRQSHVSRRQSLETITELSESRMSESQSRASIDSVASWSPNPQYPQPQQSNSKRRYTPSPRTVSPQSTLTPHSPTRSVDPPARNKSFESSSTSSDEDISRMMSDFLHSSKGNSLDSSLLERDYPNPISMPKSDWTPTETTNIPINGHQKTTTIPISVSHSSGGSSTSNQSPYRPHQANRISPDPTTGTASTSGSRSRSPRQPSTTRGILPPPQNQHSQASRSQQPDPEGRLSPHRRSVVAHSNSVVAGASPYPQPPTPNNDPPPQSIDAWNTMALQHVHSGEYDMALAAFQHVLRAYKQQYGTVHPLVASAYHNLGTVHAKRAQLLLDDTLHQRHCRAQSLQCFQSAARAARDSLGRDHPNVAVSLVRIGFLLLQARQYNNAVITFQEALRIRQNHYGPHHALVANLYNNLGVCYMHLGQFAHGRDLLHHALQIQRTLLHQAEEEAAVAEEKKEPNVPTTTSQALELADTLFNIGGLALEWIRRQGPDVRHAQDAEAAFEEALELRKSVLGPKDPMVLQVKSLLDMARSIPRPKSPSNRAGASAKPTRGNGNVNFPPQTPESLRPPDPIGLSPNTGVGPPPSARKGDNEPNLSPPRTGNHRDIPPLHLNEDNKPASSPYRYYGKSDTDSTSPPRTSPFRPPKHPNSQAQQQQQQQQQQQPSSSPVRYNAKADYLEPPRVTRRHMLDQTDNGEPPEKPRHAMSPTMDSQAGRMSFASSSASTVKVSSPGRRSTDALDSQPEGQDRGIFRPDSNKEKSNAKLPPPMMEIAVSQDEDDDGLYDPAALQRPAQTNVFISPHYVPHMSPHKVNNMDDNSRSIASSSYTGGPPSTASSSLVEGTGGAIVKTYSYDPEEQLVLTDGLGEQGNPLPDQYDALGNVAPASSKDGSSTRKIMVVRPYRSTPDDSITSPTSVLSARTPWDPSNMEDVDTRGATASSLYSSELEYSSKTTSYGEAAPRNARSETLSRARALLQAHNPDYLDSPQVQLAGTPSFLRHSPDGVKQQLFKAGQGSKETSFDEDLEDGLAPLGANDASFSSSPSKKTFHPDMLTSNPDGHMREIYEEASRRLKNHYYDEAQEYFGIILQCQRHLHGPFHQDVAAALHNCGLSQLRAGNHHRALKSFEEAVRIRKGTLGKEHPHVAASLVKCGITFLLLHRFEEALWSFREALSIRKHSLGTLHPSTARIYNNIGCVHIEFNELREARRAFEGALDIQRNALCHDPESGPVRFGAAATLCNLGYLYRYRGMHERASQVLREAADIQEDILGGTHPTVLSTLDSLAEALGNSGQASEAFKTQEQILERFQSTEIMGSRRLIRAEAGLKYKMSKSAKQMNDRDRQLKNLQQALQAVRALDEQTEAARNQAAALEKRILSDLRGVRGSMETNELNWI